jgi:hypothetical protein
LLGVRKPSFCCFLIRRDHLEKHDYKNHRDLL